MSSVPNTLRSVPIKLTYADYAELPNDGRRYEILDGDLAVTPAPIPRHQAVSRNLQRILDRHVVENGLGQMFYAPIDVILADTTIVQPDLLFIAAGREALITERAIEGPPDLVVEILSKYSVRQDRVTKAILYARFEIPHYWVLDPHARTFEEHVLEATGYRLAAAALDAKRVRPVLFPALEIDLGLVWA